LQKITAKNAWELSLIDHIGQLSQTNANEEVDFQRASTAIDASCSIYRYSPSSSKYLCINPAPATLQTATAMGVVDITFCIMCSARVDSVHSDMFKVKAGLTRSGNDRRGVWLLPGCTAYWGVGGCRGEGSM
jgi:hypothetical protein